MLYEVKPPLTVEGQYMPKWYIKIVVKIALALFDHINLKVVGFDKENEKIEAIIMHN